MPIVLDSHAMHLRLRTLRQSCKATQNLRPVPATVYCETLHSSKKESRLLTVDNRNDRPCLNPNFEVSKPPAAES